MFNYFKKMFLDNTCPHGSMSSCDICIRESQIREGFVEIREGPVEQCGLGFNYNSLGELERKRVEVDALMFYLDKVKNNVETKELLTLFYETVYSIGFVAGKVAQEKSHA